MFFSVAKMLAVRAPFQGLRYPVSADKGCGNLQLILFSPKKMTKRQIAALLAMTEGWPVGRARWRSVLIGICCRSSQPAPYLCFASLRA